jgi:hypothetical protein
MQKKELVRKHCGFSPEVNWHFYQINEAFEYGRRSIIMPCKSKKGKGKKGKKGKGKGK